MTQSRRKGRKEVAEIPKEQSHEHSLREYFQQSVGVPWLLIFLRRVCNSHLLFADQNCVKGFYLWESHYLSELLKMWNVYGKQELEVLPILSSQLYRACCVFANAFIVKSLLSYPPCVTDQNHFQHHQWTGSILQNTAIFPNQTWFFCLSCPLCSPFKNVPIFQIPHIYVSSDKLEPPYLPSSWAVCVFTTHVSFDILCYVLNCPLMCFILPTILNSYPEIG